MKILQYLILLMLPMIGYGQENYSPQSSNNSYALYQNIDEDGSGFGIALNIGMYLGGKESANLYNGFCSFDVESDPNGVRCYSITERLGLSGGVFNINTYNDVVNVLEAEYPGVTGFHAARDMYPENMRYTASFMYGLNLSYNFDYYSALVFNMNFVQLTAKDAFSLVLEGLSPQPNQQEAIELFTIWGEESRFNIQLGYKNGWEINESTRWIFEFGGSMLGSKIESNKIKIVNTEYNLIVGGENPAQLYNYVPNTQIGFGVYGTPGFEFTFQDKVTAMVGFTMAYEKVKLESYENNLWNKMFFARFGF